MTKKVEIYSRSNCSYCDMAKNFFDSKGIDYFVYNADDPEVAGSSALDVIVVARKI